MNVTELAKLFGRLRHISDSPLYKNAGITDESSEFTKTVISTANDMDGVLEDEYPFEPYMLTDWQEAIYSLARLYISLAQKYVLVTTRERGVWEKEYHTVSKDLMAEARDKLPPDHLAIFEEVAKASENDYKLRCSLCGGYGDDMNVESPYCPWCGAEMELTEEDDDA